MAYPTITWKPDDIVELTNASKDNFLLELDSGVMRLDAGRTIRITGCALELAQVNALVNAGKIKVEKFQPRKGKYTKKPLRNANPSPARLNMPKLVLIDGHSLAFRAFHALPPDMSAPTGELTNAVYGFMSMLLKVLQEQKPEYVAVSFDLGRPFRHDLYEAYKGHRERTPDELHTQVERIKQIVEALNIPIFELEPYEADDILATLALQAEAHGVDTIIVTGDRDILQVVDDHITVLTSGRTFSDTIYYTPESVKAKYGLEPNQLVDYKALIGDKSDNIPGVKGIGEKGATDVLQRYGTLDAVYADLDNVQPNRLQTALKAGRADAELSRKLGQIVTDVPVQLDLEACHTRRYDRAKVVAIFQELAFRSLANALPPAEQGPAAPEPAASPAVATEGGAQMALFEQDALPAGASASGAAQLPAQPGPTPLLVLQAPALIEVAEQLAAAPRIAFDTETTGTDPYAAELVGLAVAWGPALDQAAYIPLGHSDTSCLPWDTVKAALLPAFQNPDTEKIAHNASYDIGILDRYDLQVAGQLIDTMIAAWLIDPGLRGLGLKDLVWTRLEDRNDPHHRPDRDGQGADHDGPGARRDRGRVCRGRRRDDDAPG